MIGIGASRLIGETLGNTHLGCSFVAVFVINVRSLLYDVQLA